MGLKSALDDEYWEIYELSKSDFDEIINEYGSDIDKEDKQ